MQNTKLTFTLTQADEPIPAPDEGGDEVVPSEEETVVAPDTGTFTGTNNTNAASSIALVFSAVLLVTIAIVVAVRKLKKTGKLGFVAPVLLIGAILAGTAGTVVNRGFADTNDDTDYADIFAPETIELTSELDKEGNTFSSTKATITMNDATNYGYELYALAGADSLVPKTEGNETTISSIEETGALSANTYGYTLEQNAKPEDEVWYPLSTVASLIYSTDTSTEAEVITDIYFGILTDKDATPDAYELELSFYGIANPAPITSIDQLTYMQDFAKLSAEEKTAVLDSMTEKALSGDVGVYSLKDSRDGKVYNIGKASNGRVFMIDDLALSATKDDNSTRVLTSADSDVSADFVMPTEVWASNQQNYYCKAIMVASNDKYFYNWYAAMANPYECDNPTNQDSVTEDSNAASLGSICPAGWTIPEYGGYPASAFPNADIMASTLDRGGANPFRLGFGYFIDGQYYNGGGRFWGRNLSASLYDPYFIERDNNDYELSSGFGSYGGFSIRCIAR